jgi:maltooligosyltrehalose trehalohydrolase
VSPITYTWGPRIEGDGVVFRLYAPDGKTVGVRVDSATHPMSPRGDGWFDGRVAAKGGAKYKFSIDDKEVPDPASRRQAGDVNDDSVVATSNFAWRNTSWRGRPWHETVIYELHAGLLGGFAGIDVRLGALAALGVTAIELMPIADFPGRRNWGYDGALTYAPDSAYGSPDELRHLIDAAHGHGLMVFLDVVFNHFGPDGNYLADYARDFFHADTHTPWGAAINFDNPAVQRFFIENALYWVHEFHIDGLRLDAVHAINDDGFLKRLAAEVRASVPPERHVHLMIENERNDAALLEDGFDAQWNDDVHHALHVLLTGETQGYYTDYADAPATLLARGLAEGFIYQGQTGPHHGKPRGTPSAHLPPTSFIAFLQNHDHIGNRAFGERLISLADLQALRAAIALLLLSPQIPMLFMGEETGAEDAFLYFSDHRDTELADAVREGRRAEFAHFPAFADPQQRERIPDPNAPETFEQSRPSSGPDAQWRALYTELLALRKRMIVPRLPGARSGKARVVGEKAVVTQWSLGDGAVLTLAVNLGTAAASAALPTTAPIWGVADGDRIAARSTLCWLETQ